MMAISRTKLQNKCLNVREQVEVVEGNKRWSPLPSPTALWVVSVRERKPWSKKNPKCSALLNQVVILCIKQKFIVSLRKFHLGNFTKLKMTSDVSMWNLRFKVKLTLKHLKLKHLSGVTEKKNKGKLEIRH